MRASGSITTAPRKVSDSESLCNILMTLFICIITSPNLVLRNRKSERKSYVPHYATANNNTYARPCNNCLTVKCVGADTCRSE